MKIVIEPFAEASLREIAFYIENRNTRGAGQRWLRRFQKFIKRFAISNVQYPLGTNLRLAQMLYSYSPLWQLDDCLSD